MRKSLDLMDNNSADCIREERQIKSQSLVKKGSIVPYRGHKVYKVEGESVREVKPDDFIDRLAYLIFINKDGRFSYNWNPKLKDGSYLSSLNQKNAHKKLTTKTNK